MQADGIKELTGSQEIRPGGHNWPDMQIVVDPSQTDIEDNEIYLVQIMDRDPVVKKLVKQGSASLQDAIASIPPGLNWLIGKGKTRPDEPAFGVQLLCGLKVVAEAEDDDLCAAIRKATKMLSSTKQPSVEPDRG